MLLRGAPRLRESLAPHTLRCRSGPAPEPPARSDRLSEAEPTRDELPVPAPRWTRVVPWPGRAPELTRSQWRLLALLGAAELFDHFDIAVLSFALVQIQASLGIAENEVGLVLGWIRFGALAAPIAGLFADRWGRRRLLLVTIVGYTLATFFTAFARTSLEFTLLQTTGRAFLYAETAISVVIIAEELAAKDRGFGIGLVAALGAMGHGLASLLFAGIDVLPFGWRALYAIGALPLAWLVWLRRGLPETRRFAEARARSAEPWWRPLASLVRAYPLRLVALLGAAGLVDFALNAPLGLMPKTLQEVHGYAKWQVTLLYVLGGVVAISGNLLAGRWSDRVGRRPVLALLIAITGAGFWGFYNLRGWVVPLLWTAQVFALQGVTALVRALGSELFPTSYRSTASSLRLGVGTLAGMAAFFLEARLYGQLGSHAAAVTALLPALAVAIAIVWLGLPEPASRELEEVSPERASS